MTTTASTSTAQDYALPNDWQRAGERLALLEACHDAATFHRAQALGVPGEVIDGGGAALAERDRWFHGPAKIVTWCRARGSRAR